MGRAIVSDEVELEVCRMLEELQRRLLRGGVQWESAKLCVQALIEGREVVVASAGDRGLVHRGTKKRDLAEQYRERFERWFHALGFTTVTVPTPKVSNREFARRHRLGQGLFFRPATKDVSYEAFMTAVGQGGHWTVTDQDERAKIGWKSTAAGYWLWVEVQDDCPRLGTTWDDLTKAIHLLSLEEYVIVWHAVKTFAVCMLDVRTWCWLRTRFGPGALFAFEDDGRVYVDRYSAGGLSFPDVGAGGRALDVVG